MRLTPKRIRDLRAEAVLQERPTIVGLCDRADAGDGSAEAACSRAEDDWRATSMVTVLRRVHLEDLRLYATLAGDASAWRTIQIAIAADQLAEERRLVPTELRAQELCLTAWNRRAQRLRDVGCRPWR